ncbi:MAG TPA: 1,4-alpha-glucan branching protein GlgB, partial [Kofleriaceae bacterium]|nr:1,4-alpha-glucan branching protein GlgB [Kofleriaceae bacterium]
THYRLYDRLGAHVVEGGCRFAVWAPEADRVSVIGDWNGWNGNASPLEPRGSSGIWEGFARGVGDGACYKLHVVTKDGRTLDKADPFAARYEVPPNTASVVWDGAYAWQDSAWLRDRAKRDAWAGPMSIYEVHLGSWMREHGVHGATLDYRALGARLGDYCDSLGFTHVELMPVMEHPFYGSWGYQVTGYFAPTARYGRPEDLMMLVDTLHQAGIGVILDWVPAHFPTDAHGLGLFDGTHLFEHADPRRGFHPDWTTYIFNFARHEVRSFLISSAFSWFERFHIDGLRVDGVASMLYRDYSRQPGEWVADVDGSNHDRDAIRFLQQLNTAVYGAFPDVQMIAEESTAWGGVSRPPEHGGLGFGMKWDMGWMHDTLEYFRREAVHRRWHHEQLTFRAIYAEHENFVLPLSHDEVVHGKGALVTKLPGDEWQRHANLRLLYGYQWSLPGKKLLFMGGELATTREWNQDDVLDWNGLDNPLRAGVLAWVRDVNATYRRHPALHRKDCKPGALEWLIADDRDNSSLVFQRNGEGDDPPVIVACNFTPVPRHSYRIGVTRAGAWREVLNSDSAIYGGSDVGNLGGALATGEPWHGRPASISLTLPPLGVVYLVWEPA